MKQRLSSLDSPSVIPANIYNLDLSLAIDKFKPGTHTVDDIATAIPVFHKTRHARKQYKSNAPSTKRKPAAKSRCVSMPILSSAVEPISVPKRSSAYPGPPKRAKSKKLPLLPELKPLPSIRFPSLQLPPLPLAPVAAMRSATYSIPESASESSSFADSMTDSDYTTSGSSVLTDSSLDDYTDSSLSDDVSSSDCLLATLAAPAGRLRASPPVHAPAKHIIVDDDDADIASIVSSIQQHHSQPEPPKHFSPIRSIAADFANELAASKDAMLSLRVLLLVPLAQDTLPLSPVEAHTADEPPTFFLALYSPGSTSQNTSQNTSRNTSFPAADLAEKAKHRHLVLLLFLLDLETLDSDFLDSLLDAELVCTVVIATPAHIQHQPSLTRSFDSIPASPAFPDTFAPPLFPVGSCAGNSKASSVSSASSMQLRETARNQILLEFVLSYLEEPSSPLLAPVAISAPIAVERDATAVSRTVLGHSASKSMLTLGSLGVSDSDGRTSATDSSYEDSLFSSEASSSGKLYQESPTLASVVAFQKVTQVIKAPTAYSVTTNSRLAVEPSRRHSHTPLLRVSLKTQPVISNQDDFSIRPPVPEKSFGTSKVQQMEQKEQPTLPAQTIPQPITLIRPQPVETQSQSQQQIVIPKSRSSKQTKSLLTSRPSMHKKNTALKSLTENVKSEVRQRPFSFVLESHRNYRELTRYFTPPATNKVTNGMSTPLSGNEKRYVSDFTRPYSYMAVPAPLYAPNHAPPRSALGTKAAAASGSSVKAAKAALPSSNSTIRTLDPSRNVSLPVKYTAAAPPRPPTSAMAPPMLAFAPLASTTSLNVSFTPLYKELPPTPGTLERENRFQRSLRHTSLPVTVQYGN